MSPPPNSLSDRSREYERYSESSVEVSSEALTARFSAPFSLKHKLFRFLFWTVWFIFASWTPPHLRRWRLFLLRCFGAELHPTASVRGGAKIWYPPNLKMDAHSVLAGGVECYNMGTITIGEGAVVSQRSFLCGGTHDFRLASNPLQTRPISIGPWAWVAAEACVMPGTKVAEGCIVGARSVVSGELEPWGVYAGNPGKLIKMRSFDSKN